MGEIIFKTELIKGAKGDRGEAGQADSIPTDGVIAFQGETVPDGYEETDPGDVFDEVYEDINAVKDMIADEYDTTTTYNAGDFCTHENGLYKCTATTIGPWNGSEWVLTSASDETKATQDMISDAYDSTHTYNVGDYCIYEDALYKCNTASTTGTWDSSKWDAVTVAGELEELMDAVNRGSYSVVADGVKTYADLLSELYNLVTPTNFINHSETLVFSIAAYKLRVSSFDNVNRFYVGTSYIDSNYHSIIFGAGLYVDPNGCFYGYSDNGIFTDLSNIVPTAGAVFTIYL